MISLRSAALAAVVAVSLVLAACGGDEHTFAGYERTPTPNVADLSLPSVEADGSQTPFNFVAEEGGLLLVYFGYTRCPDVCPTTLADVRQALRDIGDDADRVDLAMVSIDPLVDTPEILTNYVRSFVDGSVALRSEDEAVLRPVANGFGADYGTTEVDGDSEVFHTASLYAIDDRGDMVLIWSFGTPASGIAADLEHLLDQVA
ncbi:MAG: SCO family protein [Acidimicrobiales bacterium]